jgi:hypothetical protein
MTNRPELNKNISVEDFEDFYWLKSELVKFCREVSISSGGGKIEIANRISKFLKTGEIPKIKTKKTKRIIQKIPKSINDVIPEEYTSSQLFREYFKSIIGPHFHFTAYMMKFIKEHPKITFKEYVDEWQTEYGRRKDAKYKSKIMKSCEYNQYIRDFFKDNPEKTLREAIKYWKIKKTKRGDNKYSKKDLKSKNAKDLKQTILNNICYTGFVYKRINKKLKTNFSKKQIERFMFKVLKKTEVKLFMKKGKNFYVTNIKNNVKITINSNTFRIITVDKL